MQVIVVGKESGILNGAIRRTLMYIVQYRIQLKFISLLKQDINLKQGNVMITLIRVLRRLFLAPPAKFSPHGENQCRYP